MTRPDPDDRNPMLPDDPDARLRERTDHGHRATLKGLLILAATVAVAVGPWALILWWLT